MTLFDIMKCNFRHTSMQYMGDKRCKDKKLIEDTGGHIAQLQYQLTNNPPDEIVPQITKLTSELNSIYDTKVKQKCLIIEQLSMKIMRRITNSFIVRANNTILTTLSKSYN